MRIAICTPTRGALKWRHVASRDLLLIHTARTPVRYKSGKVAVPELGSFVSEGCLIALNRATLVRKALAVEADYILWLDDDMTFPPDTFFRLAAHNLPMVGCNCRMRVVDEIVSTAANVVGGELQRVQPKAEGIEAVDFIGLAVCLMAVPLFRELPEPWFEMGPHGEDGHLCGLLRERGIRPVVDHDLSLEVGHIAETVLRLQS